MTTPLFIAEAPTLEIRNIINSLSTGARVRWRGLDGYISFSSDAYLTICISEKDNPPGSRRPKNQCNMLCFPHQWGELEVDDQYFLHKKAYKGKTNDHPGNEMLPELEDR